MAKFPKYHVEIRWGEGIPPDASGRAMLAFEKHLRELTGLWIEVFNETKADDSVLRRIMTPEERNKL
jgi:hypothetical protein